MEVLFTSKPKKELLSSNCRISFIIWCNLTDINVVFWKTTNCAYTKMLRVAPNVSWNQHTLRDMILRFAGHYFTSKGELAGDLIFWLVSHGMREHVCKTFVGQLAEDIDCEAEKLQRKYHGMSSSLDRAR